ncbi:MAG: hypothetical protein JWP61_1882, partial [Friedmanniella sp.]|nr:hypothetical protein [Friedmanniella sp.]
VTTGSGENPPSRVAVGQRLVQKLTSDLMRSPYWSSSAFLWTYDGWGGWYDHVVPPSVDARGYGFRVPALMVSPYARRGLVDHTVLDYTSMLKFIESNWGVAPLASRDAAASNLVSAFDFSSAPRKAALLPATRDAEVRFTPNPRATPVIYTAYGLALVGVAVLIAGVAALQRPFAQSLLRQLSHGSAPVLQAGRVRLAAVLPWSAGQLDDALARALRRLGRALHLPPRPFAVLWRWAVLGGYQPRHSWERQLRDDAATAWAAWYRTESGADGGAGPAGEEPVDWVAWYRSMSATAIVAQHGPYGPQLPGGTGPL